jgi:hypothetical protein
VEFEIHSLLEDSILSAFVEGEKPKDGAGTGKDTLIVGKDTLVVIGRDTLGVDSAGRDTLGVEPRDTLGRDTLVVEHIDTLPGMYQPWEMKGQEPAGTRGEDGQVEKADSAGGKKPKLGNEGGEGKTGKTPKSERPKLTFKERMQDLRSGWRNFKKRLKDGPTKEELAQRQKKKLDRMKKRIQKRAEKEAKRNARLKARRSQKTGLDF